MKKKIKEDNRTIVRIITPQANGLTTDPVTTKLPAIQRVQVVQPVKKAKKPW